MFSWLLDKIKLHPGLAAQDCVEITLKVILKKKMEQHVTYLDHVYRVGGKKFSSLNQTVRYEASSYASELLSAFGIDISSDKPEVHPKYVCILCKRTLLRARKESVAHCGGGCGQVQEWTQHTQLNCTLCTEQSKPKSKGRPKKSTHTHRHSI